MDGGRPPDADALLAHAGFVRALARSLLRGDRDVEDVVHDTWLVAMTKGPDLTPRTPEVEVVEGETVEVEATMERK